MSSTVLENSHSFAFALLRVDLNISHDQYSVSPLPRRSRYLFRVWAALHSKHEGYRCLLGRSDRMAKLESDFSFLHFEQRLVLAIRVVG